MFEDEDEAPAHQGQEEYMDAQEIYNKVKTHLLAQGEQARTSPWGNCVYLNDQGLKCAAGVLLRDGSPAQAATGPWPPAWALDPKQYSEKEWPCIQDLYEQAREIGHRTLVRALQHVHDGYEPKSWPDELAHVAEAFGLEDTNV